MNIQTRLTDFTLEKAKIDMSGIDEEDARIAGKVANAWKYLFLTIGAYSMYKLGANVVDFGEQNQVVTNSNELAPQVAAFVGSRLVEVVSVSYNASLAMLSGAGAVVMDGIHGRTTEIAKQNNQPEMQ